MELRQRKRLNNLPKFNIGQDVWGPIWDTQGNDIRDSYIYKYNANSYPVSQEPTFTKSPNVINPNAGHEWKADTSQIKGVVDNIGTDSPVKTQPKDYTGLMNKANAVAGGVGSIAQSVIGNLSVKSQDELLADAGRYNGSVMGVGYTAQNDINKDAELSGYDKKAGLNTLSSTVSGAQAGAAFGPVGAVIGGAAGLLAGIGSWFGGKHALRKRINNARNFAARTNIANRAGAMSVGLQNYYYGDNQYTQDDILYG